MKNKVYYGEYSLKHWIDMILYGKITLPKYQRAFVWDKSKVVKLLQSFQEEHFSPPVVIGSYNNEGKAENLIIDGQQRLTSLLLAYLRIYPIKKKFKQINENFADENGDDEAYNENNDDSNSITEWTFNKLFYDKGDNSLKFRSLEEIKSNISVDEYEKIELNKIKDDFFDNHYLGFSYLMPKQDNQQGFYSSVFKDINAEGIGLSPLESRRAFYFLKPELEGFFDPQCVKTITISSSGENSGKLDFVRYLSFLFQYKKESSVNKIAKGFSAQKSREAYYKSFIDFVISEGKENCEYFDKYDAKYQNNIEELAKELEQLGNLKARNFQSIIDADIYLFGLIF